MINFKIGGRPYKIASEWHELNTHQLIAAVSFSYTSSTNAKTRLVLLSLLVPELKRKTIKSLSHQERFDLVSLTDWVWEKPVETEGIPSFTHNGVEYLTPKPDLDDIVAIEYAMADLFLKEFVDTAEGAALDKLIATICRPGKPAEELNRVEWDGVAREKYNGSIADRRAAEFSGLPIGVKAIVLQMFIMQKRFLHDNYSIFSSGPANAGSGGSGFDIGWLSLIYDLAEQGVFGDFEKTSMTNMNILCLYLHNKGQQKKQNGGARPQGN